MKLTAKLRFVAPEGFSYVGWQRVEVYLLTGEPPNGDAINISHEAASRLNTRILREQTLVYPADIANPCLFVISGESFKLRDFAEAIADLFNLPYEILDPTADKSSEANHPWDN